MAIKKFILILFSLFLFPSNLKAQDQEAYKAIKDELSLLSCRSNNMSLVDLIKNTKKGVVKIKSKNS